MILRTKITSSSGIYIITSCINGEIYIGSAVNIKQRKQQHFKHLELNKHHSIYLQRHYNKYPDDLWFGILEFCPKENLIEREQYWMDTLHPKFNICPNAGNHLGFKYSEESRKKMSFSKQGEKAPMFGKHHTEESKQKDSIAHLKEKNGMFGKHHTEKAKQILTEKHLGEKNHFYNKKHTEEAKQKNREWHLGLEREQNVKDKIAKTLKYVLNQKKYNIQTNQLSIF